MNYYLAPMEGLTGYIFRNAHAALFPGITKYFAPFIAPNATGVITGRAWEDLNPTHNEKITLIPQLLTNKAEDFIATANTLYALGYSEVNLNLGCPSGTVVSKNKGSGFLSKPQELDRFLDEIFNAQLPGRISIKTRIGKEDPSEFPTLLNIFNQYPIDILTIHPRVQKEYYKKVPHLDVFQNAQAESSLTLCYNGDIFRREDYEKVHEACPSLQHFMLGRGIVANPGLIQELTTDTPMTLSQLFEFHQHIYEGYQSILSGERNVLFKMKEMWFYMGYLFTDSKKYCKAIKKAQHLQAYEAAVQALFNEQQLITNGGLFYIPVE